VTVIVKTTYNQSTETKDNKNKTGSVFWDTRHLWNITVNDYFI